MSDAIIEQWQDRIRQAAAQGTLLRICGGGSKDFYGNPTEGEILDTRACAGIVDYQPTELVLVARSGTPLVEIEATLSAAGQMLAFEPPHFGPGATLGGAIAAGLAGPRRPYAGAVRDLMLGVKIIDGTGALMNFGGRVMKNVAGFDVARLMAGALGTLGVLTEVALKCLPVSKAETTLAFDCGADAAIRMINEWSGKPLPLTATCFWRGTLAVRLSGAAPAVTQAMRTMGGKTVANAGPFWESVREQSHGFFNADPKVPRRLWRLSVKATAPYTDLSGDQLIEWGGALRWLWQNASADPAPVRKWAMGHGGHATLFRGPFTAPGVFQPLSPPLAQIHERLKATFDPHRIFNRGRLYADL
jgi:glycolate oxidase FAD binding subunit